MQQIERVGAIALLLLVVTMATVALWGDGQKPADAERGNRVARNDSAREDLARDDSAGGRTQVTQPRTRGNRRQLPVAQPSERALPVRGQVAAGQGSRNARDSAGNAIQGPRAQFASHSGREAGAGAPAGAQERPNGGQPGSRKHKSPGQPTQSDRWAGAQALKGHAYTVRSGDCLELIARDQCGDRKLIKRIMAMNGIHDPDRIRVGQVLQLPGVKRQGASEAPGRAPVHASEAIYVVQAGDNLSTISERTLGTYKRWREFLKVNKGLDPDRLQVGARLRIPAGGVSDRPVLLASAQVNR